MSAPNFKTMANFPLIVTETPYCKVCPECGLTVGADEDKCPECETDLTGETAVYDEWTDGDNFREMEAIANRINEGLTFFKVSVDSGYYTGLQFFVDYGTDGGDPTDLDNEGCRYYYDMNRSTAIRRHNAEINRITRELRKAKGELCLTELACRGVFSNGEAVYEKVA